MHRSLSFLLAGGLSLGLTMAALAKPERFADLAPENTAFIVDIPNFTKTHEAFNRSGLTAIWNDPSLRSWFDKVTEEPLSDFKEQLDAVNLKLEDIKTPSGVAGLAIWAPAKDSGSDEPNLLAAADFGDNAEDMAETINTLIERGERDKKFTVTHDKFGDIEITSLTLIEEEDGDDEDDWDDWDDDSPSLPSTMHYARHGNFIAISSSMDALEDALDAIGGKDINSVADAPALAATLAQHPSSVQAYAAFLTGPLFKDTEPAQLEIFKALGVSEVRAASVGLNFESANGLMEQTFGVLMNQKKGLFSLINLGPARFQPPAFIDADTASFNMFQFNFAGVIPLLKETVQNTTSEEIKSIGEGLPMIEPMAGPILNSLGSKIFVVQSYARPFSAESQRMLVAIDLADQNAFNTAVAGFGPMLGLEARDFQGNQIWSTAGAPIAIGSNSSYTFIGNTQAVEGALRQTSTSSSLAQESRFTNAVANLSNAGLGFGWSDTAQVLRYTEWAFKNQEAIIRQHMSTMFGDDPEFAEWREEMIKEAISEIPDWQKNPPNFDALLRYVGDSVFEMTSSSDGFRGKMIWLKPAK